MTLIKLRRNTAAQATADNPVLSAGEPAWESDTGRLKIGDGVTSYNGLTFTGPPLVPASGDTTGATDAARWQQILNTGRYLRGNPGSTYYLNAPVLLPSHSHVDMTGCTIIQPAGTLTYVLGTASVVASQTTTDGSCTSGNAVLNTAATAAIGDSVGVTGAGPGGSTWYGTVTATGSGNLTLSTKANTTIASGATVNVFPAANRVTDVLIHGGTWQFCDQSAGTTAFTQFPTCFRRVDGIRIRDMIISQAGAPGLGGKFNVSLADVTDFHTDNITFLGTAGDGIHVMGPASGGTITNTYGQTGDDMVVLSTEDNNTASITDTQGNLSNIRVSGIVGNNTYRPFKIYDLGTESGKFTASQIHVSDISGSTQLQSVVILGSSTSPLTLDEVNIHNVTCKGGSQPVVSVSYASHTNGLLIDDILWASTTGASSTGIVNVSDPRGPIIVRNLRYGGNNSGTNIGVYITGTGSLSGGSYGSTVTLDGANSIAGNASAVATFHPVYITGSSLGTLPYLTVRNVQVSSTSGIMVYAASTVALPQVNISDCVFAGTNLISLPSSTSATVARLSNVYFTGTSLVATGSPVIVEGANIDVTTTAAVVAATGANATPIRVEMVNFAQAGAGAGISRDGTQAISVNGSSFGADLALLTPKEGDMVADSSTRTGAAGVAIWHSGGTGNGWKNLYTAGTY